MSITVGTHKVFDYPLGFVTLPEYSAHRGALVEVIRALRPDEYDNECEDPMYEIKAADGWVGHAFESELKEYDGEPHLRSFP